jgi:carboxyl-terminal processing protease
MQTFQKTFLSTLALGIMIIASFLVGYFIRDQQLSGDDLPILMEARRLLLQHGYNEPPAGSALEYGMVRGMIQAYSDPYTSFSEPVAHELATNNLEGKFGGVGVQLQEDTLGYPVLLPLPDSPATLAGILEGDRLVKVDTLTILPETPIDAVQAALRGKVGSKVNLTIERPPDYKTHEFIIERIEYNIPSVTSYLAPMDARLGVVKVNLMAATTATEIVTAVEDLLSRGATAIALDMRDNYGGLLTSGVDTARLFLEDGPIMEEQYKGEEITKFEVESPGELKDIPLVILVNQNTASAAEIAAGALQAQDRAPLIGSHTFGKDSVQLVFELRDKSSLQVTAARWWIPKEGAEQPAAIAGVGLQPDITLPEIAPGEDAGPDSALVAAIDYLLKTP